MNRRTNPSDPLLKALFVTTVILVMFIAAVGLIHIR